MFQGHSFPNINRILAGIKLIGREWRGILLSSCNLFVLLASTVELLVIFETKELHKILLYKKLVQVIFLATSGWTLQRTKMRHLFLSILQLKYSRVYITEWVLSSSVLWPHHQQQYVLQPFCPLGWTAFRHHSHVKKNHKISGAAPEKVLCTFKTD